MVQRARVALIGAAAFAAVASSPRGLAQVSGSWIGPSGGTWSAGSNWTSAPFAPGGGGTATFVDSGPLSVWLDAPVQLGALRFDSVAQVDLLPTSSFATISFSSPAQIELARYKQNKPGVAPYYYGHRIDAGLGGFNIPLHITGPGALALGGINFGMSAAAITGSTVTIKDYYGFGAGTTATNVDGATLRFVSGPGGTPQGLYRPLNLGPGGVTLDVHAPGTVAGTTISGSGGLALTGTNTGSFIFYSNATYTGPTRVIGGGSVSLNLESAARLSGTSSVSVSGQISLLPYGLASPAANMLSDGELALRGARLNVGSNSAAAYHEHTGTLSLRGGLNTVAFYPVATGPFNSQPLSFTASALQRQDRAVLHAWAGAGQFGGGLSNSVVRLNFDDAGASIPLVGGGGSAGSTNVSIVPFAFIDVGTNQAPPGFMTYDSGGLRPLAFNEYALALPAELVSDANVRIETITIGQPRTVNSVIANGVQGPATLTITSGAIYGARTFAPIDFGPAEGIFTNGGVHAPISGTNGVTYTHASPGLGSLLIDSGALSTYTGSTTINSGTIAIGTNIVSGAAGPFGADTSPVVLTGRTIGATLRNYNPGTITFGRDLLVRSDPDLYNANAPALRGFMNVTGNVTLEGPLAVEPVVSIAGNISGPGRLVALGPFQNTGPGSALVLTGNNTFSGGVDVGTGTVAIGSDTALGTGPVYIGDGPAAGGGTLGTIFQQAGPTRTLANDFVLFDNLRLSVTNSPITLTGSIDLNGETRTIQSSTLAAVNPNHVTLNGPISGGALHLAGRFNLAGDNEQPSTTIDGGQVTVLSDHGLGATPRLTQIGNPAVPPTGSSFLELSGGVTIPKHRLRIRGDLPGFMGLRSRAGENTWAGDIEVVGRGTVEVMNFGGSPPGPGHLTVGGGIVGIDPGSAAFTPMISKTGPGTLSTAFVRTPGELRVISGTIAILPDGTDAATSVVGSLSINTSVKLDLNDNALVIDYGELAGTPIVNVANFLATGFNGGAWNGGGISSSVAASTPGTALGYAEASDLFTSFPATFAGVEVDDTSLLVRYARYGDANLDRVVNLADFNALAANFGRSGAILWSEGNFNYDIGVNLLDFNLLAANFGLAAGGPEVTPRDWANLAAAVPEPGVGVGLTMTGIALLRRRWRR